MAKRQTLWGSAELTAGLEVSRATLQRWRGRPDFPKPIAELSIGSVWDAAEVRAWHKAHTSKAAFGGTKKAGRKDGRK